MDQTQSKVFLKNNKSTHYKENEEQVHYNQPFSFQAVTLEDVLDVLFTLDDKNHLVEAFP